MEAEWTHPGQRWRLLAPAGAVVIDIAAGPLAVRRAAARLTDLPAGSPVVLLDRRPGSAWRARRLAAAGVISIEGRYVALPSLRRAVVLAEDSADVLRWACRSLVAPPPGAAWAHGPLHAAIAVARRWPRLVGWLAAGRVVIGRTA
ncbi:MAG TPA: hypothetical protein VFV41_28550 [Streptosporangiaceae bacterium]|nr:hypothetical protein [Streptosporangiaceae bacterium]